MFKNILLPVDGSELSLKAVDMAIALAERLGSRVYAFHVIAPFPASVYFATLVQANEPSYTRETVANAERFLEQVRERAQAAGVEFDGSHEVDAKPYSAIVEASRKHHCDLIVMASHGLRGFDRLLLGSETHKVILNGEVPVLVYR